MCSSDLHHVWDVVGGVRMRVSPSAFAQVAGEWRTGTQRVPMLDSPPEDVHDDRQSLDIAAGYRMSISRFEIAAGPAVRYSMQEDEVAPHDYLLAGGFARLTIPMASFDLSASAEAGAAVFDGTPDDLRTGPVEGRSAWGAGISVPFHRGGGVRFGLEYRGEALAREFSNRVSNGAFANVQVGF